MKETFSLTNKFSLTRNADGSAELSGFAIHGGDGFIVNDFFEVPASEMANCARTLQGAKLMKDHGESVDDIIGRVNLTKETYDQKAELDAVHYKASLVVDDTNLGLKIEKGLIDATSIGFEFEPICSICGNPFYSQECTHHPFFDDMHFICKDMSCRELSLVTFGADPHATVHGFSKEDSDKLIEKFIKQKEEIIMSKEDTMVKELQDKNLELSQSVKDLEAKLSKKDEEFQSEIEDLKLSHQEEILTLKQEREALKGQFEEISEELAKFRAEEEARMEEILVAKKEKLAELAKELKIEDTIEDIDSMSESFIDKQIAQLERIIEETSKVGQFNVKQTDKLHKEGTERQAFSSLGNFFNKG